MLRVLGLSQRRIAGAYALEFGCWAWSPARPACCWATLVHNVFVWLLAGLVECALPAPSLWPALFGLGVGMTLLLALACRRCCNWRGAAAARDPARRGRAQGRIGHRAGAGVGGFARC
jgi:predicted lysophospholipase L1 biosynthesis ABC-type transport system permease subunit